MTTTIALDSGNPRREIRPDSHRRDRQKQVSLGVTDYIITEGDHHVAFTASNEMLKDPAMVVLYANELLDRYIASTHAPAPLGSRERAVEEAMLQHGIDRASAEAFIDHSIARWGHEILKGAAEELPTGLLAAFNKAPIE